MVVTVCGAKLSLGRSSHANHILARPRGNCPGRRHVVADASDGNSELVTPFVHLVGMESILTLVVTVSAVVAGLVLVAVGAFSVLAILWDDLLEDDAAAVAETPLCRTA